jgi:hypothetical protein
MRLYEFVGLKEDASAGATSSGSIATVSMPMGTVQRRISPDNLFLGKYTTELNSTPNTPDSYKQYKRKK